MYFRHFVDIFNPLNITVLLQSNEYRDLLNSLGYCVINYSINSINNKQFNQMLYTYIVTLIFINPYK